MRPGGRVRSRLLPAFTITRCRATVRAAVCISSISRSALGHDHPALNVFQSTGGNPAQMISPFSYIFSTTKQSLTGKQGTCFEFCVRLLFTLPKADLFTLLDLLDDRTEKKPPDPRFLEAFSLLTAPHQLAARRFFDVDFYSSTYATTRQEIKTRVWEVLKDEHLFAMFNAPTRTLDMVGCIRKLVARIRGKVSSGSALGLHIAALILSRHRLQLLITA
jgi:hypothetical protein